MAEKDLTEKILLSYNDVFADIVNTLVFHGENRVSPSSLQDRIVHSQYKADTGVLHEEERDVFKVWENCGVEIALCGIENQTVPYHLMPGRVIGYDGASYRNQILEKGRKRLTPVVTMVLYFGMEHWNQPTSLKGLFGSYPQELGKYISDYKINVFEVAWFTEDVISAFKSDFKVVANFFSKKRLYGEDYVPDDPQVLVHVDAVLKLLSVMTGDSNYESILRPQEERRNISMCEVAEKLINKGISQGISQGITQGRNQERADNIATITRNLMARDPSLSKSEAEQRAKDLLK